MKILYTNFHQYHKGGHATYILNLFQELSKNNVVHVADPVTSGLHEEMQKLAPDCIFAQEFPKRITKIVDIFRQAWKLRQLLKKNQYDIIHVNGSPDLQIAIMACFLLRPRPRIVYTKHNSIPISRNIFSVIKFKCAKAIIVVCGCQQQDFLKVGIPKKRLTTIKNGLDTAYFAPALDTERMRMRKALGFSPNDIVLVSNAGISDYKRWDCMISAAGQINSPNLKVLIVGGDPTDPKKLQHIQNCNMTERTILAGDHTDTRPYIAAGDVGFVLSDSIETVSFACREMMSMGKPVIVSDYACLPQNVTAGENGWITPVGNVDAIRKVLEWIIIHQDQLPKMGEQARVQALREFGIKQFADATYQVYQNCLAIAAPKEQPHMSEQRH